MILRKVQCFEPFDVAQLPDLGLEDAVGGGVGDHDGGEVVPVLLGLRPQVVQIDVAVVVALHHHDFHAGHHRAGRIGTVGRRRNTPSS